MSTTTKQTTIEADPILPTIRITRDFDAPRDKVFQAWVDPDLYARWVGPRDLQTRIDEWEAKTGGRYRFASLHDGQEVAAFYGSFHEVRENERIVWTFTWEGMPDGVSLETMTFEDLGNGCTRVVSLSVVDNMAAREAILSSGMDVGVNEGYEKLDELLAG